VPPPEGRRCQAVPRARGAPPPRHRRQRHRRVGDRDAHSARPGTVQNRLAARPGLSFRSPSFPYRCPSELLSHFLARDVTLGDGSTPRALHGNAGNQKIRMDTRPPGFIFFSLVHALK